MNLIALNNRGVKANIRCDPSPSAKNKLEPCIPARVEDVAYPVKKLYLFSRNYAISEIRDKISGVEKE